MALDMEVGLGPSHIVLDGDPAPLPERRHPPIFGPCLLWPNGCIRIPLSTEVDLSLGDIVLYGTQLPSHKGTQPPPIFGQCPLWPNGWMD